MDAPRLFDSPAPPPTTRTIALTIVRDGADGLDQAQRRADNARYQEVTCRSALNAVKGMPFQWTLNPYRGCTHACHYCFARRYQTQFALGPDDEFSSIIFVKINFPEMLAPRAREAVVEARAGRARHRDRPLSTDRRSLQADAAVARGADRGAHAGWARHQGTDGRSRRRSARRAGETRQLHGRASACRRSTKAPGRRSSRARRIRCSACARFARCEKRESTPAC